MLGFAAVAGAHRRCCIVARCLVHEKRQGAIEWPALGPGPIVPHGVCQVRDRVLFEGERLSTAGYDKRADEGSLVSFAPGIGLGITHLSRIKLYPLPSRPHME